jgi:HSP20 family protein
MYLWRTGREPMGREVDRLRRDMDNLFSAFSGGRRPWMRSPWRETRLFPLLNVRETSEAYVVSSEIPGMKTEDLEIKLEGDTLSLKGERKPDEVEDEASFHRRERVTGAFQRSITLPGKVDNEKVTANYKDGVLTVTLLKEKKVQPKQITISSE